MMYDDLTCDQYDDVMMSRGHDGCRNKQHENQKTGWILLMTHWQKVLLLLLLYKIPIFS